MLRIASYHPSRDRANLSAKKKPHHSLTETRKVNTVAQRQLKLYLNASTSPYTCFASFCVKSINTASITISLLEYKIQSFHRFYELFPEHITLKSGKIYSQYLHLKMFVNAENTTDAPAARDPERLDGVLPDLIEERIRANLETLSEHI